MNPDEDIEETDAVKVSIKEIDAARRSLDVEVPASLVAGDYEKACRAYARKLKVAGFRKGKVPLEIIKQRFGKEIEQETVERTIDHALQGAIADARPAPLRLPVLKEYKYSRGEPLTFRAEYEVRPKIEVKGVDDIRVTVPEPEVTDRMIGETLEELRERAARFEPVTDRGVNPGDHVVMDVTGEDKAGKRRLFHRENVMVEIGSGGPHPELTDPLRGMKVAEKRGFDLDYPPDHSQGGLAGKKVSYTVSLREIKTKILPDLDDEFARDLGGFDTLEELRSKVTQDLIARERQRLRGEARRQVIDQLLERNPDIAVPDVLVQEEMDRRVEEVARGLALQGMDPRVHNVDWDEIRRKQRDPAVRSVGAAMLLDAIGEERKIALEDDDLGRAIAQQAERRRQTPEALRAQLSKDGRLEMLEKRLLREKILDFLLAASNT
ncbi:MAG: trigger factor [Acidobacteriota bacterium]